MKLWRVDEEFNNVENTCQLECCVAVMVSLLSLGLNLQFHMGVIF